ncbi:MAG: serine/threonine-protein phosphatase, partial [Alphaproteobacteria bacterium]|nr:serine/threonine-protein phosphatase [Alphaproteobacteria bacterium]
MAPILRRVLSCLLLLAVARLHAQAPTQPAVTTITLGQAAVPLNGPWKFHIGDSPIDPKTDKPLWAEPDFDDSQWETVDLTAKPGATDLLGNSYLPGWMARGHADYWGYAWYRIRIRVNVPAGQSTALAGPDNFDDAFQFFANGSLLGGFGNFNSRQPIAYNGQPTMFILPNTGAASGSTQILAFRFWLASNAFLLDGPDPGGMHGAPAIGELGAVQLAYQAKWLDLIRLISANAFVAIVFGLLALMAFGLLVFDRSDSVYAWMGLLFLLTVADAGIVVLTLSGQLLSIPGGNLLNSIIDPLSDATWVIVWWIWFGRGISPRLPQWVAALTVLEIARDILRKEVFVGLIPESAAAHLRSPFYSIPVVFFGLLIWIVMNGIRRQGIEGWLVLPVVLLRGIGIFLITQPGLAAHAKWFPFGINVSLVTISNPLIAIVIALLLLRRLLRSLKRQRQMAIDVKEAQEVQEVILPERRVVLPGFEIESEYRPAREVGGDFFQILPNEKDGSLLIVAGDVTGKGLKAGMLVALLVGAIRSTARFTQDPVEILSELNRRLLGRGDARATCLALRIERSGSATLANAGHLPPYLNGKPMEIDGSLPLGMIEQFESSVHRFQLAEKDRLLLLSDGVAEATDEQGKLFGFERVLELVRTQPSATQIAEAAQAFGQEDDISVIAVTRIAAPEPALA